MRAQAKLLKVGIQAESCRHHELAGRKQAHGYDLHLSKDTETAKVTANARGYCLNYQAPMRLFRRRRRAKPSPPIASSATVLGSGMVISEGIIS